MPGPPDLPLPGSPSPLGANWDGRGTNFAVESAPAECVELCLFDDLFDDEGDGGSERRLPLLERTFAVWHGYLPGVGPGQRYGFRVHGPWAPERGLRCDPAKLLLDPYARAVDGPFRPADAVLGREDRDGRDSAPYVPRSVVVDGSYDPRWATAPATA